MGVTASPDRVTAILNRASQLADQLFCSEVSNVDVAKALGSEWDVAQFGSRGSAEAGCALAIRRVVGRIDSARPVFATEAGHGIRDKTLAVGLIVAGRGEHRWSYEAASTHGPPMRAWELWPAYMRAVRRLRVDVAGGDWNKLARAVAPALGRKVRAHHILAVVTRFWIPSSDAHHIDVGSDHPLVIVTLWP